MRILILGLILICGSSVQAQHTKKQSKLATIRFQSLNSVGVQWGERTAGHILYSANGIHYKGWFMGVGTGIDYYQFRSIPLLLDIRKKILAKENTPFAYAAAGRHFTWQTKEAKAANRFDLGGTLYYDVGVGYQLPLNDKLKMIFTLGISEKEVIEEYNTMPWSSVWPLPPQALQKQEHQFRRIAFKIGLGF